MTPTRDPVLTLYRVLLAYGAVGILILAVGLVEFVHLEPLGQTTNVKAHIVGVYQYDPAKRATFGPDQHAFSRSEQFAAVVDWSTLPADITVQAIWYDSFGNVVGRVGPGTPAQLAAASVVPAAVPAGLKYHLPGQYIFAVERLQGGLPVEVLARRIVEVQR